MRIGEINVAERFDRFAFDREFDGIDVRELTHDGKDTVYERHFIGGSITGFDFFAEINGCGFGAVVDGATQNFRVFGDGVEGSEVLVDNPGFGIYSGWRSDFGCVEFEFVAVEVRGESGDLISFAIGCDFDFYRRFLLRRDGRSVIDWFWAGFAITCVNAEASKGDCANCDDRDGESVSVSAFAHFRICPPRRFGVHGG